MCILPNIPYQVAPISEASKKKVLTIYLCYKYYSICQEILLNLGEPFLHFIDFLENILRIPLSLPEISIQIGLLKIYIQKKV